MATKNITDLLSQAASDIPDNTTQEISASDVRTLFEDIIDSFLNLKDGGLLIETETGYSSAITPSSNYAFSTKKYVDDSVGAISLDWGSIGGTITDQTDLITYLSTNYQAVNTSWLKAGNTLSSRGKLGSTSGAYGIDFYVNNSIYGSLLNDGKWSFGASSAFTDTYLSVKGHSNTSATYAQGWQNSDGTTLGWMRNDGTFQAKYYNIDGYLFARYNEANERMQLFTPQTPDKTGVGTAWLGIGRYAMYSAVNPSYSTAIGHGALVDGTTYSYNSAFGFRALYKNTTGSYNVGFGPETGYYNLTGSNNIWIGRTASPVSGLTNADATIVIASGGVVRQSNTAVFGSNDTPITKYVLGRGESEILSVTPHNVTITANSFPYNVADSPAYGTIYFAPMAGRGTGTSGDLVLQYCPPVASGTTLQSFVEAFKVRGTDGISIFSKPAKLASYTVATLPAQETGAIIYVSDESGGAVVAFSDGTNWRRVTDRAVVS